MGSVFSVMPIPVAVPSKELTVLDHSKTRIMGSNPARGMDVQVCIQKFTDWVDNEVTTTKTLNEKQHKGLWRQNSLDWLTK
jgi:hypothetical protein